MIKWIYETVRSSESIDHKTLESYRGFLIYFSRTYPSFIPYLKGIHLTLDSWRPWRREDGWKLSMGEIRAMMEEKLGEPGLAEAQTSGKAPKTVKWVKRLMDDSQALMDLMSSKIPPKRPILPPKGSGVVYGFGDASGSGFGSSLYKEEKISYTHGQWTEHIRDNSSNFRELSNIVLTLERAQSRGELRNSEVFLLTDNSTSESAFFKGTSKSEKLFDLVLRLHKLHLYGELTLHVVHVAGRRMMMQGTDGLSRGESASGLLSQEDFLSHMPLNLSAPERQSHPLKERVDSWFGQGENYIWLEPREWYTRGHSDMSCVWTPPPAIAEVALEQLAKSVHKRPHHTHLVIVPRLMTARWRKLLLKICDLSFTVPIGTDLWNLTQCEPLIVGICLHMSRHQPWKLRGTPLLVGVERILRDLPPSDPGWGRDILRKRLKQARDLESLPESVVQPLLHSTG
jgi:hypothetical protein